MTTLAMAAQTKLDRLRSWREGIYAGGKVFGESGKAIDIFPTGITAGRGRQLCELLRASGPLSRTVETGFAFGLSSLFILEAALEQSGEAHHTAIDPFQRSGWGNAGLRTIREAGVAEHFTLMEEDSALVLPCMAADGQRFDAAFVDGSHTFDGVFVDVFYLHRLVRPGGLIILDDLWMPAVRAALGFFRTNIGLELETYPDENGKARLAVLRNEAAPRRAWDHYVPFGSDSV